MYWQNYDTYFAAVFLQAEVEGVLDSKKIRWSDDFVTVEESRSDVYYVLVARNMADVAREPSFEILIKPSKFVTNMVDLAREKFDEIRDTSGPDDSRIREMAVSKELCNCYIVLIV